MKKYVLCILCTAVLTLLLAGFAGFHLWRQITPSNVNEYTFRGEFQLTESAQFVTNNIMEAGCARDEKTATGIATSVLTAVYGEGFDDGFPLLAFYDSATGCWLIKTQFLSVDGSSGGKYIIIRKSNAEIVGIWGTKN